MNYIPFIDLQKQRKVLSRTLESSIKKVLDHGKFIIGPEVERLEKKLSNFTGSKYVISCASGTDALKLVLMVENIGEGDVVIVPSFSFVSTAEAPAFLNAKPFFVDVNMDTFNIDVESIKQAIFLLKKNKMKPKAIITVDLFGQPAEYNSIIEICKNENILLIADSAQSFGATYESKNVGNIADYTTTSFFPSKPLGCYGDGGAVFTNNKTKADKLISLRSHGKGKNKYDNVNIGLNSRLDTIQASILLEKLKIFKKEIKIRNNIANKYNKALKLYFNCPEISNHCTSSWALYTIKTKKRNKLMNALQLKKIPSSVYYPKPLHKQVGYKKFPRLNKLVNSESLSKSVLSIPLCPYLSERNQEFIIHTLLEFHK
ncbi:MAG: aminotransferase DegT [Legionellales bacterium]|nr:aminotransferase DegT [Legionellales bacterium]